MRVKKPEGKSKEGKREDEGGKEKAGEVKCSYFHH